MSRFFPNQDAELIPELIVPTEFSGGLSNEELISEKQARGIKALSITEQEDKYKRLRRCGNE